MSKQKPKRGGTWMKHVGTATVRGKAFEVLAYETPPPTNPGALGFCTGRRILHPKIGIRVKQCDRQLVNTVIHEGIHAWFDREFSERNTRRLANDLTRLLFGAAVKVRRMK